MLEPSFTFDGASCRSGREKSTKEIQNEIRALIRQITATVTFLPLLDEPCTRRVLPSCVWLPASLNCCLAPGTFDLLVYTDADADVPKTWEESDPKYIQNSTEVRLRSFTTRVRSIFVVQVRRRRGVHDSHDGWCRCTRWTPWLRTKQTTTTTCSCSFCPTFNSPHMRLRTGAQPALVVVAGVPHPQHAPLQYCKSCTKRWCILQAVVVTVVIPCRRRHVHTRPRTLCLPFATHCLHTRAVHLVSQRSQPNVHGLRLLANLGKRSACANP